MIDTKQTIITLIRDHIYLCGDDEHSALRLKLLEADVDKTLDYLERNYGE